MFFEQAANDYLRQLYAYPCRVLVSNTFYLSVWFGLLVFLSCFVLKWRKLDFFSPFLLNLIICQVSPTSKISPVIYQLEMVRANTYFLWEMWSQPLHLFKWLCHTAPIHTLRKVLSAHWHLQLANVALIVRKKRIMLLSHSGITANFGL